MTTATNTESNSWANSVGRSAAPLRDQVAAVIRKAILDFELKPGQRLTERELIERLGVSRTTVRDVLLQLTGEGLVTVTPQRGATVTAPTPAEAQDLYEMRALLEGLAARLFVERGGAAMTVRLRQAFTAMVRTMSTSSEVLPQLRARDEFDAILLRGASSQHLQQLVGALQVQVRALRAASLSDPDRPAQAIEEIRSVVEAIEAGDADAAAEATTRHIRHSAEVGLRQLAADADQAAGDADLAAASRS